MRVRVNDTGAHLWVHRPPPTWADDAVRRLEETARDCLRVPHARLLPVEEVGHDENGLYVVTRALEAEDWESRLRRGALPRAAALEEAAQICDALAELYAGGGSPPPVRTCGAFSVQGGGACVVGFGWEPCASEKEQVAAVGSLLLEAVAGIDPSMEGLARQFMDPQSAWARVSEAAEALRSRRRLGATDGGDGTTERQPASPAPPVEGERLGPYRLMGLLGQGGMGQVYRARHTRLERDVAIKRLRAEYVQNPEVVHRFFQEARVVNRIRHPNIVEVLDFIEEPGRVYCVMELLEGTTLLQALRAQGPMPVARVLSIGAQVCDALEAAHLADVIHRDVKPENIFLIRTPDGGDQVKVLDFGIAKLGPAAAGAEATRTSLHAVLGTPMYMAPEQAQGGAVDARADVYSVGAVLYELLTGRALVAESFPRPALDRSARGEPIPAELASAILASVEMEPTRRPPSVAALRRQLASASARRGWRVEVSKQAIALTLGVLVVSAAGWLGAGALNRRAAVTSNEAPGAQAIPPVEAPPPPVEPSVARPTPSSASQKTARLRRLTSDYRALVERHGEEQLTEIERAAYHQVVANLRGGKHDASDADLRGAEAALRAARARLER